jgi:hypothetical protein
MANPSLLLCDTDSLIQLFLTSQHNQNLRPLRVLRDDYGIQPTIVEEVETELMWTRRYGSRFVPQLKKATASGLIERLDVTVLGRHVGQAIAKSVHSGFQALGQQYSKHADPGEAYTFAAAVTLGVPALSNDKSAVDALDYNGMALPSPVLRAFDVLTLSYQVGALAEKECDKVRKELLQLGEHVPRAFRNASFADGLAQFCPRILDGGVKAVGTASTPGPAYAVQILCTKK